MSDYQFTKPHHLLVYILSQLKEKEPGNIELVKLIYLIDLEYYRLFGKLLTGFHYVRQKFGPYSREFSEVNSELEFNGIIEVVSKISRGGSSIPKRTHKFVKPEFQVELLPEEKEVTDRMLKKFAGLSPKRIEQESYNTEPMQEIIEDEKKLGKKLIGTPLNFSCVQRDKFMENWLSHKKELSQKEPDLEYEEFLLKEKREFVGLLR